MSSFTTILLLVILVLISSDVYFLRRIFKKIGKKKNKMPDERYFELKYNINLLKAVSAILIFLIGFLGFTTYKEIISNVETDFQIKFEAQEKKVKALDSIVKNYEINLGNLKSSEDKSIKNLNDIKEEFLLINKKVAKTQAALKYTSKIYVVSNLKFPSDTLIMSRKNAFKINFKDLRTIHGERLPKFKTKPFVTLQGRSINLDIAELTSEYIKIGKGLSYKYSEDEETGYHYFDMWIAEPN